MIDWLNPTQDILDARRLGYEERDAELAEHISRLESDAACLRLRVARYERMLRNWILRDQVFINHIRSHLDPGQSVVCKICGREAYAIVYDDTRIAMASHELLEVARMAVDSQGWPGNAPDDDRWSEFYAAARAAVAKATGNE